MLQALLPMHRVADGFCFIYVLVLVNWAALLFVFSGSGGRRMLMADGFTVDRAALAETAQGISDTISDLEPLGVEETAGVGRGFSGLALSGLQAGDGGLASAFGGFCDRWSWGVRALVQDGSQFARRLGLAAGVYAMVEEQLTGAARNVVVAVAGDPHMSDQQAAAGSWSQDAAGVTGADTPGGRMTWGQAGQAAAQQWTAVAGQAGQKAADPASMLLDPPAGLP